jgi:polysaccharide pyruvyl transferase WcaK-like protein
MRDRRSPPVSHNGSVQMSEDSEITWHREQIEKNRAILQELEEKNTAGDKVFPETQSEIDHLKAQISQSELIVAAGEKGHSGD